VEWFLIRKVSLKTTSNCDVDSNNIVSIRIMVIVISNKGKMNQKHESNLLKTHRFTYYFTHLEISLFRFWLIRNFGLFDWMSSDLDSDEQSQNSVSSQTREKRKRNVSMDSTQNDAKRVLDLVYGKEVQNTYQKYSQMTCFLGRWICLVDGSRND